MPRLYFKSEKQWPDDFENCYCFLLVYHYSTLLPSHLLLLLSIPFVLYLVVVNLGPTIHLIGVWSMKGGLGLHRPICVWTYCLMITFRVSLSTERKKKLSCSAPKIYLPSIKNYLAYICTINSKTKPTQRFWKRAKEQKIMNKYES